MPAGDKRATRRFDAGAVAGENYSPRADRGDFAFGM